MKKYGFFGGSFNPPSVAHKKCAESILNELNLDKVFFVPVGNAYKKQGLINEKYRYDMLKLICKDNNKLDVSDIELNKNINYKAIDIFKLIKETYQNDEVYFIMGADNFKNILSWQNSEELIKKYKYILLNRNNIEMNKIIESDNLLKNNKDNFFLVKKFKQNNINSTELRKKIKNKEFTVISNKIDESVLKYIQENNLYTQ